MSILAVVQTPGREGEEVVRLTFDRSAAEFVLQALSTPSVKPRCAACQGEIKPDTFAGAVGCNLYCSQLPCLICMDDKIQSQVNR